MDSERLAAMVAQEVLRQLAPMIDGLRERPTQAPEYLTLADAAHLTRFSYGFVYDAVRKGELPATKKGRDWRVAVSDLRNWMERDRGRNPLPPRSAMSDLVKRHMPGLSP